MRCTKCTHKFDKQFETIRAIYRAVVSFVDMMSGQVWHGVDELDCDHLVFGLLMKINRHHVEPRDVLLCIMSSPEN